jgi:hypothetical protein
VGLLRLARLSRLERITRLLCGENRKTLVKDVLENRSQYAGFITILLVIIVLIFASVLVLQSEGQPPEAKITTGKDAFWYSIVTITTVGAQEVKSIEASKPNVFFLQEISRNRLSRRDSNP